jgi:8-oxo-dGTP pyrophosphatase MutT (NUDIX family)
MTPLLESLRRTLAARTVPTAERRDGIVEAAVALLLRENPALEVLLIHRAELEGDPWSGHIALPGGRREAHDPDLLATALREAEEELGAAVGRHGEPLGALPEIAPSSPRLPPILIAPFVIGVPRGLALDPDPREVQSAFWVPVGALRDSAAATEVLLEDERSTRRFPGVRHGSHTVWGLTLRALRSLFDALDDAPAG